MLGQHKVSRGGGLTRRQVGMAATPHQSPRKFPADPRNNKERNEIMSDVRRKYDEDFKKNAVKLSFASNKSVAQVARDLGVSDAMLYRWRQKYTPEGDKTRYATMEEENKSLRLRNAEQAIEIDMLKKASAYFASLRK